MSDPHHLVLASPRTLSPFTCTRRTEDGSIRLILAGELDLAVRPFFETALADAQTDAERVLLDLRALTLIDCANLFLIFTAAERSHREEWVLTLLSPRGQVRRVLDLVGVPRGSAVSDHEELPGSEIEDDGMSHHAEMNGQPPEVAAPPLWRRGRPSRRAPGVPPKPITSP